MSEVKPNSPNGQGHVYGQMGGHEHMYGQYTGHEAYGYGCGVPMGYGYGYGHQPNQAPVMHGYHHGYSAPCKQGGGSWGSMGTILVLFILLVIISKTMFI